jgi:hypothetical protein
VPATELVLATEELAVGFFSDVPDWDALHPPSANESVTANAAHAAGRTFPNPVERFTNSAVLTNRSSAGRKPRRKPILANRSYPQLNKPSTIIGPPQTGNTVIQDDESPASGTERAAKPVAVHRGEEGCFG